MNHVESRQFLERVLARQCIADLLAAHLTISVNDGEESTLRCSTDPAAILAAMFTTDEDYLLVHRPGEAGHFAWVYFIYGNSGWDVVSDYTVNLEETLARTSALAESMDDGDFFTRCEAALIAAGVIQP